MKLTTTTQARKYLETNGIIIEPEVAYNIYTCGCIVKNREDPKRLMYAGIGKNIRACPSKKGRFLVKYKRCSCGCEYIGTRIVDGPCKSCWPNRRKQNQFALSKGEIVIVINKEIDEQSVAAKRLLENHRKASAARFDCVYRDKCLTESLLRDRNAETLLCWGCKKYKTSNLKIETFHPIFRGVDPNILGIWA